MIVNDDNFKCSKCSKKAEILHMFGPVLIPDNEEGKEYCCKCWDKHPLNTDTKKIHEDTKE